MAPLRGAAFLPAALAVALSACASTAPTRTAEGVLTNPVGMTLYTFDNDPSGAGKSVCNGPCAALWPPLMADAAASASGDYTIVTRDDGGRQWAYRGKPLYLWSKDARPGERTGDGFRNVWHVAKP